jgi:hypothetical protein
VARLAAAQGSTDASLLAEVEAARQEPEGAAAPSEAAALGYLVGVCPTVLAAAPMLTEDQILEALRLGSGLELEPGALADLLPKGMLAQAGWV